MECFGEKIRAKNLKLMASAYLWFGFFIDAFYESAMKSHRTVPHNRGVAFSTCIGAVKAVREVVKYFQKDSFQGWTVVVVDDGFQFSSFCSEDQVKQLENAPEKQSVFPVHYF